MRMNGQNSAETRMKQLLSPDYRPTEKEDFMNPMQQEYFRQKLLAWKQELLRESGLNFYGNVEGNDIYKGTTDVVVCDGFVGNVALKTSEGLASMLATFVRQEFKRNLFTQLAGLIVLPVLKRLQVRVDHRRHNGAALLGLRGLVFKSHGSADAFAFEQALNRAYDAARNRLLLRVHDEIVQTLQAMPAAPASEPSAAS